MWQGCAVERPVGRMTSQTPLPQSPRPRRPTVSARLAASPRLCPPPLPSLPVSPARPSQTPEPPASGALSPFTSGWSLSSIFAVPPAGITLLSRLGVPFWFGSVQPFLFALLLPPSTLGLQFLSLFSSPPACPSPRLLLCPTFSPAPGGRSPSNQLGQRIFPSPAALSSLPLPLGWVSSLPLPSGWVPNPSACLPGPQLG